MANVIIFHKLIFYVSSCCIFVCRYKKSCPTCRKKCINQPKPFVRIFFDIAPESTTDPDYLQQRFDQQSLQFQLCQEELKTARHEKRKLEQKLKDSEMAKSNMIIDLNKNPDEKTCTDRATVVSNTRVIGCTTTLDLITFW